MAKDEKKKKKKKGKVKVTAEILTGTASKQVKAKKVNTDTPEPKKPAQTLTERPDSLAPMVHFVLAPKECKINNAYCDKLRAYFAKYRPWVVALPVVGVAWYQTAASVRPNFEVDTGFYPHKKPLDNIKWVQQLAATYVSELGEVVIVLDAAAMSDVVQRMTKTGTAPKGFKLDKASVVTVKAGNIPALKTTKCDVVAFI